MGHAELEPAPKTRSGVFHLRSITGLRFIAAFVVFVSHVQHFVFPEVRHLPLGGPAVSFFFVLSGFILSYVYDSRLTVRSVPRFWFTRWARLWPLHIVCVLIAVWFLMAPIGSYPKGNNSYPSLIAQVLMVHAWVPIKFWFTDFNSVSWSISTELFFYLLFPLLLLGKRKYFWIKMLVVIGISFGCLKWIQFLFDSKTGPEWLDSVSCVIAFPLVRMAEFAVGMGTCQLMLQRNISFASEASSNRIQFLGDTLWEIFSVALIVISWMFVVQTRLANFLFSSPEVGFLFAIWTRVAGGMFFYAFLIFVFASRRGLVGQIMGSRLAVWLGEISFAFYLIHQIVIVRLNFMALNDLQFMLFSFSIALFASALLYRVVEMPCRNALLAIYDRKGGWFGKWTKGLREIVTTKWGMLHFVTLAGLLVVLWFRPVTDINNLACQEIMGQTPQEMVNVGFHEEAYLLGYTAERVERGVLLKMVWKRKRSWSRKRFLHICDSKGNILGQGPMKVEAFQNAPPNQMFIDQVVLNKRSIKGADYIAVGFWSEEDECAPLTNREGEMNGYRIKLFDLKSVK